MRPGRSVRSLGARLLSSLAVVALLLLFPATALPWGLGAHRWINERAIQTLPEPIRGYFVANRRRLSDLAVEPDTVRRARDGRREAVRHFIDLDLYGAPPFPELPRSWPRVVEKFGRDVATDRGRLPWTILERHRAMVRALRGGRWDEAVRIAGLAGHYVGDGLMPLHTTDNHDGQRSGNRGIHAAIERSLVDARLDVYAARAGRRTSPAQVVTVTEEWVFAILLRSHARIGALLEADHAARALAPFGGREYLDALDARAGELLAAQLGEAVERLGALWLSAWDEVGRPPPPKLPVSGQGK